MTWGFFTFQRFVFFLIIAFSCLSFSSFPLILDLLKPKSGPSNEVIGEDLISQKCCNFQERRGISNYRKRAEYCFKSTVSKERTHWVLRQTRWVLRETRWVRFGTQIIGRKELTELSPRNSARARKLTDPNLLFLAFLDFLAFLLFKEFLAILSVFPFFPKDFEGSASKRHPCFFGGFPCRFPKRQGKDNQGSSVFETVLSETVFGPVNSLARFLFLCMLYRVFLEGH